MAGGNGYPFRDEPLAVELANTVHALKGEPVDGLTDVDQLVESHFPAGRQKSLQIR